MSKPAAVEDIYPLSPLQAGLLFHTLLEPNSGIYFEQLTCELHGTLDEAAFARTWKLLAERHSILRTAFVWKGQREPVQVVHVTLELPWHKEDWRGVDAQLHAGKLAAFLAEDRRRGFELNRAPLMRIATIRLADNLWQLVSSHHHILLDGWSFPLLLREFGDAYRAFCAGTGPNLAPARPYSSYVAWLKKRDSAKAETFWRGQMRGFTSPTPISIDHTASPDGDFEQVANVLSAADTEGLQTLARESRVTLNTLVQGAYALVLSRYSGSQDVVFGVTVAGRPADLPGVENIVGLFINTLPFRAPVPPHAKAAPWLRGLQERQLAIQELEYTGLADIQRWSDVTRGQPLFESLLVFENYPIDASLPHKLGGLEPRAVTFVERTNYPLTIIAIPRDRLGLRASFDTRRLDRAAVERMLGHIVQALLGLARPGVKLGQIDIVTPAEQTQILTKATPLDSERQVPETLHEWFAMQVQATPDAIALTDAGREISYRELDGQARRLAARLVERGVRPADRVGLLMERNAGLVAGILGILQAGAAYVPMDPIYPDDRLAWMVSDAGIRVVVTQRSLAARVSAPERLCVDDATGPSLEPVSVAVSPQHPAYVIYTSGSTGRPKGCLITHGSVTRLFRSTEAWFGFGRADVWTLFHSAAFDFSVWEIWGALLYGGRLVVVPYYTSREPEAFLELVMRESVTVLNQTPSAFRQFMAVEERLPLNSALALRCVIFGGEALDLASLRPWFERHGDRRPQLVNMYGITETTVHVTYRPLTERDALENRGSLIGIPLPDLRLVTLDTCGHLVPVGVPGELFVAGAGLSPGYLDRPELTAQRFVADPFGLAAPGGRLYRTGDLAKRLPDGDFEYLGRIDSQVKIRGFRIELGEIESELTALAGIREAVVLMREDRLVAYLVAREGTRPPVDDLRAGLRLQLPEYMVPAAFVWLDKLPLTPNGKLDRAALPEPGGQDRSGSHIAPRNEREAILTGIWGEVLHVDRVGVRDNYFALGGDSIRSLAIRSRAREKGIEFTLQELFEKQTIEALLSPGLLGEASEQETGSAAPFSQVAHLDRASLPPDVIDAYPLTRLQLGMLFHSHEHSGSSRYLDSFGFQLRGPLDRTALQAALDGLVDRHAILRTSFDLTALPEPLQRVHSHAQAAIQWTDLAGLPDAAQESAIDLFVRGEAGRPFDWTQAPLFRVHLHPRGETFQFTLSAHHVILDGWSVASLLTELFHEYLYRLGLGGKAPVRLSTPLFSDFVALERTAISNAKSHEFWTSLLADAPRLALPGPLPGSASQRRYVTLPVEVSPEVSAGLVRLAERLGVPLKTVLLTAHVRVLSVIGGQENVVTGVVSNGRPEVSGADRLAGLFLNVLPLRVQFPQGSWADAAAAVFAVEKSMMPHRRLPLAEIQRSLGTGPLFDTDFNFVNFHIFDSLRGLDAMQLVDTRSSEETNFALAANFSMEGGSLSVDQEMIDPGVAASLPDLYNAALTALALNPDAPWRGTPIAPEAPALELSVGPPVAFPDELLLHELVEMQVDRTPDAVAVVDERSSLTYAELDTRANRLAHWLNGRGVRPDSRVGIALPRSVDLVVAMLAALKAGAAWLPLDPDYPAERLALLTRDSGAEIILTDLAIDDIAGQPDSRPVVSVWPETSAYVIYTSGSTGTPKGVVVPHSAIVNHMLWMQREFPLDARDVVLQKTPASFDASVWEFWAPLMAGARLAMAQPGGHQDPAYLADAVHQYGVTTLQLVPSMLDFFLEAASQANCGSLRRVFSGGEPLRPETRNRFFERFGSRSERVQLVNLYGPTEAAIDSVIHVCEREGEIPIGRPIANLQAWVLDNNLAPVPTGAAGELYLGGAGLARGYLGRPGLTAERFLPDHLSPWPGMRLYRTGDLVRQRADGMLFFVGRADDQVKIRGHRVEPGEIEAVLGSAPEVERAVVVPNGNSLVAYVTVRSGRGVDTGELLAMLRDRLPAPLVPAHIMVLDRFPLSPNGKLDRRSLPSPDTAVTRRRRALVPPTTDVEMQLAGMWKNVLGISEIGIHDNFFELGGDSIQSLRLVSIAAHAGWRLRPKQVFDHPTIAGLARVVQSDATAAAFESRDVDFDNIPLTPVQREFFALAAPNPHHWNQAVMVQTPADLSAATAERAWKEVAGRHSAFRLRFADERAGWRQYLSPEAGCTFSVASIADLDRVVAEAHSSLDIHHGPLARSVFFADGGRWFMVAHHLAIDGVSWRILLEELALACTSPATAIAEEVSFPTWAGRLRNEANSQVTKAESMYWRDVTRASVGTLPRDFGDGRELNVEATVESVRWSLDERGTNSLLRELPAVYRCRVEELLLTALAAALGDSVVVDLEGHGRDGDLAHTAGWFTTVYPVRLPAAEDDRWARLRGVKEALRTVPRGGIGYGLLRHYSNDFAAGRSDISFNYLGQIDLALSSTGPFRPASEPTGKERSASAPRAYLIDVIAMVSGGRLRVEWLYSRAAHRRETVEKAAERFASELQFLLTARDEAQAVIAADFPLAGLDRPAVAQIIASGPPLEDIWPLTPLQEGMFIHSLHEGDSGVYCQQVAVELTGRLKLDALHEAWAELARRHEALRIEFRWQDLPAPRQIVRKEVPVDIAVLDWTAPSTVSPENRVDNDMRFREWLATDRAAGFDLESGPLWRVTVFRLAADRWRLVWSHHHLLLDGWSLPIVFRQLLELYASGASEPSPFRHADFLAWLAHRDTAAEAEFWKNSLAGYRPDSALELGPAPIAERSQSATRTSLAWELTPAATRNLQELARNLQITLSTCVQAVWGLVLARWTKQSETVFGLVVAGRPAELPGVQSAAGMFINTLPLRVGAPRRQRVGEWLRELHNQTAALHQFEHSRLVDVQSWSEVPRGRQLFEAVLIIENYPLNAFLGEAVGGSAAGEDIGFGKVETFEQTNLPLNLYAVPGERLELRLEYAQSRFQDDTMRALADSIGWLLESLPAHASDPLGSLSLLRPAAAETGVQSEFDRAPVHERISYQAGRQPSAVAIVDSRQPLTYGELDIRSNRLAHHLRASGAGPGKLVGVYLDRSPDLVVALLGILKTGAAYVPMDPAFPVERLAMMVADSRIGFVVTRGDLATDRAVLGESIVQVRLDADAGSIASRPAGPLGYSSEPAELAYVIFTSGSTGRPKGVQVTHGALANFLSHFARSPGLEPHDLLLAVTTLSFDIAALELFLPLVCGARLSIATRETAADSRALAALMAETGANVMQATPATWRLLLADDWRPAGPSRAPFHAWCGGEALPLDLARDLLDRGLSLWNFYGPTETTIWSTTQQVVDHGDAAFIGQPIANTVAWVLDEDLNPVPRGMAGELYLGGEGVARGYVGRPGLTAERFIPDPFGSGGRLYATGDQARWDNGRLTFLGRADQQVKIRGFRIELEEIEQALRAIPQVRAAAVAARDDHQGNPRLVAWVQGLTSAGGAAALRTHLRNRLPDYMIPAAFIEIAKLPLTPNGKLDRRALPDMLPSEAPASDFVPPGNAIEQVLADLWREVLGVEAVGARSHFFELGGHSLLAAQALTRIRKYFQVDISLRTFFQTATPESVAGALTAAEPAPGRMLKIATALLKVRSMTPAERAQLRERAAENAATGRP